MREEDKATACVKFYCGDCAPKGKRLDNGTFLAKCSKCGALTYSKAARSLCGAVQVDAGITAPEPELAEETEALEEAVEEAVEAEIEAAVPEEKAPEETPPEPESNHSAEELDIALSEVTTDAVATILNRDKEIAELEAKLAKLKPTK